VTQTTLERIANGSTDLVLDHVQSGQTPASCGPDGVSLIQWCARYGNVSAIRFLLGHDESLGSLGENFGLGGAVFHAHWRLCEFLLELVVRRCRRPVGCSVSCEAKHRSGATWSLQGVSLRGNGEMLRTNTTGFDVGER